MFKKQLVDNYLHETYNVPEPIKSDVVTDFMKSNSKKRKDSSGYGLNRG